MKRNKIPEDIGDYLRYENGKLFWTKEPSNHVKIGYEAKAINNKGYKIVGFKGTNYLVHRVAWFLAKGEQPPKEIDHINNDKLDNRIENLRGVTRNQNQHNSKIYKNNKSGVKGVYWLKKNRKWVASLRLNNKPIYLGSFTDLEDAANAVRETRQKLHGKYTNHG